MLSFVSDVKHITNIKIQEILRISNEKQRLNHLLHCMKIRMSTNGKKQINKNKQTSYDTEGYYLEVWQKLSYGELFYKRNSVESSITKNSHTFEIKHLDKP